MTSEQISKASDKELEVQLITCDYGGKIFKQEVLDELILRAYTRGQNNIIDIQSGAI